MFEEEYRRYEMNKLIEELVNDLIKELNIKIPINNIDEIVTLLGGKVIENTEKFYDCGIEKTGRNTFNLYIPAGRIDLNRNIYIASKLGRLFLHTDFLNNNDEYNLNDCFVFNNKECYESIYQENYFGSALVMPYKEYKKQMDIHSQGTIVYTRKIADYFGVSTNMACWRGKQLGLIKE